MDFFMENGKRRLSEIAKLIIRENRMAVRKIERDEEDRYFLVDPHPIDRITYFYNKGFRYEDVSKTQFIDISDEQKEILDMVIDMQQEMEKSVVTVAM